MHSGIPQIPSRESCTQMKYYHIILAFILSYEMRKVLQQLHSKFTSYTLVTEWMYVLCVMSPG